MHPSLSPEEFVQKWSANRQKERSTAQEHFLDVCRLVGAPTPNEDPTGERMAFEKGTEKIGGGQGFADVWYDEHFAIEYKSKGKYKDLSEAYQQLLRYRENLKNPPLLVVTDIENWEIHTNWPSTEKRVYKFTNTDLTNQRHFDRVRYMFHAPDRLHPGRTAEQVTIDAAKVFERIATEMRDLHQAEPKRIAAFLTKIVFCLFAEDVGLLPVGPDGRDGVFTEVIDSTRTEPTKFVKYMHDLFEAMNEGGDFLFQDIPYFNGQLFANQDVEALPFEALNELEKAARLDWSAVEPAIFGTLFERSLDPAKRAQLGAHYTSASDIKLIIDPVLMAPLEREWDAIQAEAVPLREKYDAAKTKATQHKYSTQLLEQRDKMLARLRSVTVLDPACGSGNFLYVALQKLLSLEKTVINHEVFAGLDPHKPEPQVHPRQLFGIEINPIAHALATIVVWIGYIQWRTTNGYWSQTEPILQDLSDNIRNMDAILAYDEFGNPTEPAWPKVDVIVGNPPFLGAKKLIRELGEDYVSKLRRIYEEALPGFSDLVTYWFEKSRDAIQTDNATRVGLLATNSIAMGTNLTVLKRIKDTGDIFFAYSDRDWILDGAALRVAMIGFDNGSEQSRILDEIPVQTINANLTATVDVTTASTLAENERIAFVGNQKSGPFDFSASVATKMLKEINQSEVTNSSVLKRYYNALDVTKRDRGMWVIDFGPYATLEEASQYEAPFDYVKKHVFPIRQTVRRAAHRERWWLHGDARPGLWDKITPMKRYIATPLVSKHRLFTWLSPEILPSNLLIAITREDDYFFGVLHSRLHEVWSLRMGTWLGKGNDPRYTPTTTFETFPFPWPPGQEPTDDPRVQAIASAAKALHDERSAWQDPPDMSEKQKKHRTLTNLYNALSVFRGKDEIKNLKRVAEDFAPRLDELHNALDKAVCAAYGWPLSVLEDEEEMLRRLLALNLERAAGLE